MDIVRQIALEFAEIKYQSRENVQEFVDDVESESYRHRDAKDQTNFVSTIIGYVKEQYDQHYIECKNRDTCDKLKDANKAIYYLNGVLKENQLFESKSDLFNNSEKNEFDTKIDKILEDLKEVKKGQEIIYNDIYEELEELKQLYFLGKKTWKQLLAGKTIDMIAGGVISETVSKELIRLSDITINNLLN